MNNNNELIVDINTNIEQLHSTWVQTMFQMVTAGFLATTFIKQDNDRYKKYFLITHLIGFLTVIMGIYTIYYTYILDIYSYKETQSRLSHSRIVTIIILLTLLFISGFVLFI